MILCSLSLRVLCYFLPIRGALREHAWPVHLLDDCRTTPECYKIIHKVTWKKVVSWNQEASIIRRLPTVSWKVSKCKFQHEKQPMDISGGGDETKVRNWITFRAVCVCCYDNSEVSKWPKIYIQSNLFRKRVPCPLIFFAFKPFLTFK